MLKKYLAVDDSLFGRKYKFYDSLEEIEKDKAFLADDIYIKIDRSKLNDLLNEELENGNK